MSFDCITEGSKDYIKYVLQLTEESMTGITYVAPGRKKETKKDPSFTFSGGAGGKGLGGKPRGDTIKPGDFIKKTKKESGDQLRGPIMFGTSAVPGVLVGKPKKGKTPYSTQGGLDYLTSLSQAQSAIDFANQMMPAAVKLALSASLFGTSVGAGGEPVAAADSGTTPTATPGAQGEDKKTEEEKERKKANGQSLSDAMKGVESQKGPAAEFAKQFAQMGGDVIGQIEKLTGAGGVAAASPLAAKVMKATKNLGALDPFNPLLGLQLGVEMLGGKEVLRRTRELGAAQSAGAASTMGHPSGFRGY